MKIYLTGFMGAGKSFIAEKLAKDLGYHFIDLDEMIEDKFDMKIARVFQRFGEQAFRLSETAALQDAINLKGNYVISCGGGCLLSEENYINASNDGKVFFIDTSFELCRARFGEGHNRPLALTNEEQLKKLYDRRRPVYLKHSSYTINGDNDVVTIIKDIKKKGRIK